MQILTAFFVISIGWSVVAYRTDISPSSEKSYCAHTSHRTFKPGATCCANQVVRPGIDFKHYEGCLGAASSANSVADMGWNIYKCILQKNGVKEKVSLQEFSDLITKSYPEDIKSKINEEIKKMKIPVAPLNEFGRLEKVRITYYDIERQICEGLSSDPTAYGKVEMCSIWKEELHRSGMCCKKGYPVDWRYKTPFDIPQDDAAKKGCMNKMYSSMRRQNLNVTEMSLNTLGEMCDVVCLLPEQVRDAIVGSRDYFNIKIEQIIGVIKAIPILKFIPPEMMNKVEPLLSQNDTFNLNATIEEMQNFEFADLVPFKSNTERTMNTIAWVKRPIVNNETTERFKWDFVGRKFHKTNLHVPIFCNIYKQMVTQMERFLFQECKPEDVTEAPAPAPEPEPEDPTTSAPEPEGAPSTPGDTGTVDASTPAAS